MKNSFRSFLQESWKVILLAAAYFISGKLGLLLAIPPGYATAVWPPAGIGLAALLLWGEPMLLGIWLGSFCLNMSVPNVHGEILLYFKPFFMAMIIASGAAITAFTAKSLIEKYVGYPNPLDEVKKIFLFLILAGPLSCVVSATIGVGTLFFSMSIDLHSVFFSWFTWWVGDSLGVIVFAPALLILYQEKGSFWNSRKAGVIFPLFIAFIGAIALFLISNMSEQARLEDDFTRRSQGYLRTLQENNDNYLDVMNSIESFFLGSKSIEREEFHKYAKHLMKRYPGIQTLAWSRVIKDSERDKVEAEVQKIGITNFYFKEKDSSGNVVRASKRSDYNVLFYSEPEDPGYKYLGFDLNMLPDRAPVFFKALSTGVAQATGRTKLLNETHKNGFVIYVPIFKNSLPTNTLQERSENIIGYIAGIFEVQKMLALPLIGMKEQGIDLNIVDVTDPEHPYNFYSEKASNDGDEKQQSWLANIDYAGRKLQFNFYHSKALLQAHRSWASYLVLLGAMLFTGLLEILLLLTTGRTSKVEALVKIRTKEVEEAREVALQSSKLKSEFLANMSHEVRTPMNGVMGMAELLMETKLSTEQTEYTENILKSSQNLLGVVNEILDFSKIEAGKLEIERIEFNLNEILEDVRRLFSFAAKRKKVKFILNAPQFETKFCGDPSRIRQVLINLTNNALKFTHEGKVEIAVSENEEKLRFEVLDTGVGIPKSAFPKIFESFSQVDSSTTRKYGGSGLGLAICSGLVELMSGKIGLQSDVGRGSCFWFEIPLEKTQRNQTLEMFPIRKEKSKKIYFDHNKILVAEDNTVNQIVILKMLEKQGLNVKVVNNGKELIDELRLNSYDCVLLDCQMPEMDGFEATSIIRNNAEFSHIKSIPIIALTASAIKGDREKCLSAGMDDYISKPINFDILASVLDKWLPSKKKAA